MVIMLRTDTPVPASENVVLVAAGVEQVNEYPPSINGADESDVALTTALEPA